MANCCDFYLKVVSEKEQNVEEFISRAFEKKGFGRIYSWSDETMGTESHISGICQWNAEYSMDDPKDLKSEHLSELSKELKLEVEIWASDLGLAFQEHLKYANGKCICLESKRYEVCFVFEDANEFMPDYKYPETEEEENEVVKWYNEYYQTNLNPEDLDENGTISVGGFSNFGCFSI